MEGNNLRGLPHGAIESLHCSLEIAAPGKDDSYVDVRRLGGLTGFFGELFQVAHCRIVITERGREGTELQTSLRALCDGFTKSADLLERLPGPRMPLV
jgi:hypothetical protein